MATGNYDVGVITLDWKSRKHWMKSKGRHVFKPSNLRYTWTNLLLLEFFFVDEMNVMLVAMKLRKISNSWYALVSYTFIAMNGLQKHIKLEHWNCVCDMEHMENDAFDHDLVFLLLNGLFPTYDCSKVSVCINSLHVYSWQSKMPFKGTASYEGVTSYLEQAHICIRNSIRWANKLNALISSKL